MAIDLGQFTKAAGNGKPTDSIWLTIKVKKDSPEGKMLAKLRAAGIDVSALALAALGEVTKGKV